MAWSTRQLAELAGTTVKAVRHYHSIGLLDEPERAANGYKQYQVAHLVRLLRIKRLTDLDVPLGRIAAMGDAGDQPEEALRLLDAELAESIKRLERVRAELAVIMRTGAPTDLPAGFSEVAGDYSNADRALILIYSRVFDDATMERMKAMLASSPRMPVDADFEALQPDAPEHELQELAERYAPVIRRLTAEHPWIADPGAYAPRGPRHAERTIVQALVELYNPAQLDVLRRAQEILTADVAPAGKRTADASRTASASPSVPGEEPA